MTIVFLTFLPKRRKLKILEIFFESNLRHKAEERTSIGKDRFRKWPSSLLHRVGGNRNIGLLCFHTTTGLKLKLPPSFFEGERQFKGTEGEVSWTVPFASTIPRTRNFVEIWLGRGGNGSPRPQWKLLSYHRHRPQSWVIKFRCK